MFRERTTDFWVSLTILYFRKYRFSKRKCLGLEDVIKGIRSHGLRAVGVLNGSINECAGPLVVFFENNG